MDVKIGWNTEYGRQKFDVVMGEDDLRRMLAEFAVPPDYPLTTAQAFRLLELEARRFAEIESTRFIVKGSKEWDNAITSIQAAKTERDKLLLELKTKVDGAKSG